MRYLLLAAALVPTAVEFADSTAEHSVYFQHSAVEIRTPAVPSQSKCLATMIYGEARGESKLGKIAVAYSAVNRAKRRTVCQEVLRPMQYSIFNKDSFLRSVALDLNAEPRQRNEIDQDSWQQSLQVAKLVLSGAVGDPTGGATHYIADQVMASKGYVYPKWSKQYTQVAEIGGHRFFKPYYPARKNP